ncbi:prephenate dehydratase [Kozakia baliensis]|uniref:prephenate dehydratase n=1 Tax=Kozakia baliensis TaxID=153496 RepID=UPI000495B6F4|nr:prephenate dehydratase [Kozakia baliensis]
MSIIAFQGRPGAYSDLACRKARPGWQTLPCESFADAIQAVRDGRADLAMLACENSLAGRVPEIHALLPDAGLPIVGEHFQRVEHCLIGLPGTRIDDIKRIHTHPVALGQVRRLIESLGVKAQAAFDTAGAVELVAEWNRSEEAAVASELAAELNGLEVLRRNVEDADHNTTRFYIVSREAEWPEPDEAMTMTTLLFRVKNTPGALYQALGGFAQHAVNMTRLESYMLGGTFAATQFLMDVEGHPKQFALQEALKQLRTYCDDLKILGVYPVSPSRYSER